MTRRIAFPRAAGVHLHPTSLPGVYGIGDFGPAARRFVEWMAEAGLSLWQMCPLGPTGYGDSPYQCLSAFAGNPLLISLDGLVEDGYLERSEVSEIQSAAGAVDYGRVIDGHLPALRRAWERFERQAAPAMRRQVAIFAAEHGEWLDDYTLFAALKDEAGGAPWYEWDDPIRRRRPTAVEQARVRLAEEIRFQTFLQFQFFSQWRQLRAHAHAAGVRIVGDMPIFVAHDSAECWAQPELFQFDQDLTPIAAAGVPPDYFSETGQLWGNPLYRWDAHKATDFVWWVRRLRSQFELFDFLRVDHFRGFAAYWRVPWGDRTAERGEWVPTPGRALFDRVFAELGALPIIAEDLGLITPDVVSLMEHCGFPGMKVLQFAFDPGDPNDYFPHNYEPHSVVYTGTHDNDTVQGWMAHADEADQALALRYLHSDGAEIHWDFIRAAFASVSRLAIVPMQDFLGLGSLSRMNVPGTTGGNWSWRMAPGAADEGLAARIRDLATLYQRTG